MGYSSRVYIGPYLILSSEIKAWIRDVYRGRKKDDPDYDAVCTVMEMDFVFPEFIDNVAFPYNRSKLINTWHLDENSCKAINLSEVNSSEALKVFNEVHLVTLDALRRHGSVEVKYGVISYVS